MRQATNVIAKLIRKSLIIATTVLLSSCATGYISSGGEPLKRYLSPSGLKEITARPDPDIWIIDLRTESSYKSGHIPTAKSYPTETIMDRLDEISKDRYLILYCVLSPGAQMAIKKLEKAGYTRMMNWGAFSRWPFETEKKQ